MPELPEVETMCRGVAGCVGGRIRSVERGARGYRPLPMTPSWRTFRARAIGQQIVGARRIAKRVLLDLSSSHSLVFQPKMSGLLLIGEPPTSNHLRLRIQLSHCPIDEILYWDQRGLGSIHLWSAEEVHLHLGPGKLGPDAIAISERDFIDAFQSVKKEVKPALLDQSKVAGIGNLYASEILFAARVSPTRRCHDLSRKEWSRIYQATQSILLEAIDREGSTLGDGTYRNALNEPGDYQHQHQVYARNDEPCFTCRRPINRLVQSQRSTFYCSRCQK